MNVRQQPLISIVTPSYNQGEYIEETITSVLGQNYPNIEYIIIDGGSTDQTSDIVSKYASRIAHYISEPDHGQTDALNKGFRLATGGILAWLNSDDLYLPCALAKVVAALGDPSVPRLLYGGCLRFFEGTNGTEGRLPEPFDPECLTYYNYFDQSSVFWTRSLWEQVGELDASYHYVMDWDWWIRASRHGEFATLRDYLSIFRMRPQNKTGAGGAQRQAEILKIVETYAPECWRAVFRDVYAREDGLRKSRDRLSTLGLHRFRYLFYPHLWLKHRGSRLDVPLSM